MGIYPSKLLKIIFKKQYDVLFYNLPFSLYNVDLFLAST